MKKLWIFCSLLLALMPILSVQAQSVSLSETFVDPDGEIMFNYPKGWRTVTGGLSIELIIPNSFSYLNIYIDENENDPVDAIEVFTDPDEGEPTEFLSNDRPAAQLTVHKNISVAYYAVTYAPNTTATMSFIATQNEVRGWHKTMLAILDTIRVPEESDIPVEPDVEIAEALELSETYEAKAITFDYPEKWFTSSYRERVVLSNVQRRAEYREPEFIYLESEEVVVVIFPRVDTLPGIVLELLDLYDETPEGIATLMGIDVTVEAEGANLPDVEEFEINGQEAATTTVSGESEDYLIITLELADGEIATVLTVVNAGELHLYQATIEALVETLAQPE